MTNALTNADGAKNTDTNQANGKLQVTPITKSISMTTFEENLLVRFQQEEHLRSFSAAWSRQLIDWARLTGRLPPPAESPDD